MTIINFFVIVFGGLFIFYSLRSIKILGLQFVFFGFLSMAFSLFGIPSIYSSNGISFISFSYLLQFLLSFIPILLGIKIFKSTFLTNLKDLIIIDKSFPFAYKKYLITCLFLLAFYIINYIESIQTQAFKYYSSFDNFFYLIEYSGFYFAISTFMITIIHIIFSIQYRKNINNKL